MDSPPGDGTFDLGEKCSQERKSFVTNADRREKMYIRFVVRCWGDYIDAVSFALANSKFFEDKRHGKTPNPRQSEQIKLSSITFHQLLRHKNFT